MNCCFKLTEQGEVIFARYGNSTLARRHIESVAGATLTHASTSVQNINTGATQQFAPMTQVLEEASRAKYEELLGTALQSVAWAPSRWTTCAPFPGSSPGPRRA